jgi:hypothetical protein
MVSCSQLYLLDELNINIINTVRQEEGLGSRVVVSRNFARNEKKEKTGIQLYCDG